MAKLPKSSDITKMKDEITSLKKNMIINIADLIN